RERGAIDDSLAHVAQFLFEESVPCNFGYQVECAEQRYSIFHQSSQRARKLGVITVSDDPPISGNRQLETIPTDAPFVTANQRPETDNRTDPRQHTDPPIA